MYAKGGADCIISMSFDDGYYDTALFLNEQFAEKGLKGSLAFIADRIKNADAETKAKWQSLIAEGNLEAINHSATHLYIAPDDGSYPQYEQNNTEENYQSEIVNSRATMEEIFGYDPLVFCPAGGIMSGDGFEYVKDNYYSARLTQSIGNVVKGHEVSMQTLNPVVGTEPGDWYNLKTLSVYLSGSAQRAELLCDYVDTAIAQKGWFLPYCHGVVETGDKASANNMTPEDAKTFFSYIQQKQNEGKVWCAGVREATIYIRERQASTATVTGNENSRIVSLTMADETSDGLSLTGEDFTMPLTVKAEVPSNWGTIACSINGETAILNAFSEKGKRYVYVDLVPNGENATFTMNTSREDGDDHQALSPSLAQFWQAEYVFNESDYSYAAKTDTAPEYTKEVALSSNTKTTVTSEFTTGDADKLTNLVIADISDAISGNITIDNVVLSSDKTQITDAVLSVASAAEANVSYTVGKFIYSDNGNLQDSLSSATDAVKVNVYNGNMANFSPILVVAVYKENKLIDLYVSEKQSIAENSSRNLECNGINLENKDYDDVKVFIWNEMEPI